MTRTDTRAEPASTTFPGFVDLQVNGTHGIDFSADGLTRDDCVRAFELIRSRGSAAFLPTVITSPVDRLVRNLRVIADAAREYEHSDAVAGMHVEGPFLDPTPGAIGAHNPDWVLAPDPDVFDRLFDASRGTIRILTVAAGTEGVERLIEHAVGAGVVVSLGHHMGGYAAVRRAADAGATLLTHLGNGIPHDVNRHENPLLAGLAESRLSAGLITDGHHLPRELIGVILSVKRTENVVVVSDAAPVEGLPPGRYSSLGNEVEVTADGLVINPVNRYLSGSGRTMLQCMNHLASLGVLSYDELLRVGLENPARCIGIDPDRLRGPGVSFSADERRFLVSDAISD